MCRRLHCSTGTGVCQPRSTADDTARSKRNCSLRHWRYGGTRQTQGTQNPPSVRTYRFDSCYRYLMPYKNKSKRRELVRKHYFSNKPAYRRARKRMRNVRQEFVDALKRDKPCTDCGGRFSPWVMDFDHVRGRKVKSISDLIRNGSIPKIKKEVKKCELVCSNCHRERSHNRAGR